MSIYQKKLHFLFACVEAHIIPECAIGYKKFAKEMAGSPMILGVWSIRKKVSVKF